MSIISIEVQQRILNYMSRLDGIKPSEFERNFVKEWFYLNKLKDLILKNDVGEITEEMIKESGLLE